MGEIKHDEIIDTEKLLDPVKNEIPELKDDNDDDGSSQS